MPDQKDLQAILTARFDLEMADAQDKSALRQRTGSWLTPCWQPRNCTEYTFLEAIKYVYAEYRRDRLAKERPGNQRRP